MKMEQTDCSETSAYKIQRTWITQTKEYDIQNTAKVWNQEETIWFPQEERRDEDYHVALRSITSQWTVFLLVSALRPTELASRENARTFRQAAIPWAGLTFNSSREIVLHCAGQLLVGRQRRARCLAKTFPYSCSWTCF